LAHAAEFRDNESTLHSWRVGRLAGKLAAAVSTPPEECERLAFAARLHDVGKIAIPDEILFRRGPLEESDWALVRRHTEVGAQILTGSSSPLVELAEQIARSHHERWDGQGYPDRLRGAEIPLPARIVAVADVFDVLTHERAYDGAWTQERARDHIAAERARQFDPALVDAFLALDLTTLAGSADESSLAARG
jgi:putative two-component system response regulator